MTSPILKKASIVILTFDTSIIESWRWQGRRMKEMERMVAHVGKRRVVGWCYPQNQLSQCIVSYPRIDYYVPWNYSLYATNGAVSTTLVLSIGYIPTYCAIYEIYMMWLRCSHFHCRFLLLFFVSAYDKIKTKNHNTISLSNKKIVSKDPLYYIRGYTHTNFFQPS